MSYDQVAGIKPCVQQLCLDTCNYEEMQAIWDTSVCAGRDGGPSDGGTRPSGSSGCHCAAAGVRRRRSGRAWPDCRWRRPRRPPVGGAGEIPRDGLAS